MKIKLKNMLFLFMVLGLSLQSCNKDDRTSNDDVTIEELRGGKGGPNGGPSTNNSLNDIDNDLVNDWIDLLLNLERYAGGMRPNASARALAYINLAAYETAAPAMRQYESTHDRLDGLKIKNQTQSRNIDYRLALNTCYADVIDHFLINVPSYLKPKIEDLEGKNETVFEQGQSDRTIRSSKEWGAYVASQVIAYSQTDLAAEEQILEPQPTSYEPPTGAGYWTYSDDPERALFPYWERVRTFIVSPEQTTTRAPKVYNEDPTSDYYAEMMDVYNANNEAKVQQGEQLWIAEFWSDDVEGLMMSPPARQVSIANQLIDKYHLGVEESLALMVKLGFSLNDAAVSTWKYKYEHMVMRPSVFIQDLIDPSYETNLYRLIYWPNPSFPGYPSGHSCFASAAGGVFIDFFGNQTNFVDRSHEGRSEFLGEPREFQSFRAMARENAFSRIPLGVHIDMDCAEGLRLGYEISDAINDLDLKKRHS